MFSNIYTADIIKTTAFIYTDNIALIAEADTLDTVETILNRDLNKTVALDLNNKEANRKLDIKIDSNVVPNEKCSRYL